MEPISPPEATNDRRRAKMGVNVTENAVSGGNSARKPFRFMGKNF
jgi:hypothetical protein